MEKKKLLVVVDMQNDFVTGVLGTKEAQAIVEPMAEYIKNFDGDIIFTYDTHYDTHDEAYLDTLEGKKLPVPHCIRGSEGWHLVDAISNAAAGKNCTRIEKGIFGSSTLAMQLRKGSHPYGSPNSEDEYSEIQFCGVCTGICVISNAIIARTFAWNTPIKVIERLCACVTPESHKTAIEAMRTCQVDII